MTTLGCALLFLAIGEFVGLKLKHKIHALHADLVDNSFGSLLAAVSILAIAWLGSSILSSVPYPPLQQQIRGSKIISTLNQNLPPAPDIIASISHLINPNDFPQVFTGREPAPPANIGLPSLGRLNDAVAKSKASVVKIEGQGCGGVVDGSGFVVDSELVVTNAHVVAGIDRPYVSDGNGNHRSVPIWFDPDLDLAVLRVQNLAGNPLPFDTDNVPRGAPAAVLGYPGGGAFEARPASILDEFTATGRNIYGHGRTERDVYELRADGSCTR
jgi:S1-C subfamily serine protease